MPCSRCHQTGHNIRTCPLFKGFAVPHPSPPRPDHSSEKEKVFDSFFSSDSKSVHFPENPTQSSIIIPKRNKGKKVKYTPSRPCVRSGKARSVLETYFLASQSDTKAMNIVEKWKKYC